MKLQLSNSKKSDEVNKFPHQARGVSKNIRKYLCIEKKYLQDPEIRV